MDWQYIIFFLMAAFPALMWVVGQMMESKLAKKGFPEEVEEREQTISEKFQLFLTGIFAISSMVCLAIGVFNYTGFLMIGIFSFIAMIILMFKLGVIHTLLKG